MNLPNSFRLLTVSDYPLLKPFFNSLEYPLAIYSLPSLIAWNSDANPTFFAIEDDLLLLMIAGTPSEYSGNSCLLLPLSTHREINPRELADLARYYSLSTFCFIPENYVEHFGPASFKTLFALTEQPDYSDYIYLKKDLMELKGKRYLKKRNHIHKFRRMYVETGRTSIESLSVVNIPDTLHFLDRWCAEGNRCNPGENLNLALESRAARIMLENLELLEAQGIVVRIDNEICAFGIVTSLTSQMKVLNFEKADSRIRGLYQFLDQECARRLFEGVEYINKESDMGIPGLANSKKSYDPIKLIRSCQLKLLSNIANDQRTLLHQGCIQKDNKAARIR